MPHTNIRTILAVILALAAVNCDYVFNLTGPTSTNSNTSTNTNTNTNTNNFDLHDLINFAPTPTAGNGSPTGPGGSETNPLPIPAGAEQTARTIAEQNPSLVLQSCQDTFGEAAWQFMDRVVAALKAADPRWGYLCKRQVCSDISRDVIAYRATTDDTGAHGVDIIGGHCGPSPVFTWNVIGYDPNAIWRAAR
jgi:hypothetical protein